MKKFMMTVMLMLVSWTAAAEVDRSNPYVMMNQVAEEAFARLAADQAKIEADPEYLRTIVKEEFLPYVNARYAAYRVLGQQLKATSEDDREKFVDAFTQYMVASYAQVLTQYEGQTIEIEQAQDVPEGRNIVTVRVEIIDPQRPPIRIDFAMRENSRTGAWSGFDMTAEGVSLLTTMQNEWGGKIRANGAAAVADELLELANKPITKEVSDNG
uniref:phospholipid-binding protein MlaC n=1 Tax=Thaumasiovibrio occultus TaxID=1891184 RepID=UPI000B34DAC2|nr:phospholipid-binding protein MlaC [Thaumasiovibrio occultus]